MADGKRPTVATVFGVLNVVFGGLGLFSIFGALAWFTLGATILGILSVGSVAGSAILLVSGIFLLTNKKNALSITQLAIFVSLGLTAATVIYGMTSGLFQISSAMGSIIGGLIYPALIFFLLLKSEPVKSWYNSQS